MAPTAKRPVSPIEVMARREITIYSAFFSACTTGMLVVRRRYRSFFSIRVTRSSQSRESPWLTPYISRISCNDGKLFLQSQLAFAFSEGNAVKFIRCM